MLLVLPLLLNSAVPAFALKQQEAAQGAGAEELGNKLKQLASTVGLNSQPSSISSPAAPATPLIAAGAEEIFDPIEATTPIFEGDVLVHKGERVFVRQVDRDGALHFSTLNGQGDIEQRVEARPKGRVVHFSYQRVRPSFLSPAEGLSSREAVDLIQKTIQDEPSIREVYFAKPKEAGPKVWPRTLTLSQIERNVQHVLTFGAIVPDRKAVVIRSEPRLVVRVAAGSEEMDAQWQKHAPKLLLLVQAARRQLQDQLDLTPASIPVPPWISAFSAEQALVSGYVEGSHESPLYPGSDALYAIRRMAEEDWLSLLDPFYQGDGTLQGDYVIDVTPHAGTIANLATYFSVPLHSKITGLSLLEGGQMTEGVQGSFSAEGYEPIPFPMTLGRDIDYDAWRNQLLRMKPEERPRLVMVAGTVFVHPFDYRRILEILDEVNQDQRKHGSPEIFFAADISQNFSQMRVEKYPSPIGLADFVTWSTRHPGGSFGGMLLVRKHAHGVDLAKKMKKAVFPRFQAGFHTAQVAAKAALAEWIASDEYRDFAAQIQPNAQALARELTRRGFVVHGNGAVHFLLLDPRSHGLTGKVAEAVFARVGIKAPRNLFAVRDHEELRFDGSLRRKKSVDDNRISVAPATFRGMREPQMARIAQLMDETLRNIDSKTGQPVSATEEERIRQEVKALMHEFPVPAAGAEEPAQKAQGWLDLIRQRAQAGTVGTVHILLNGAVIGNFTVLDDAGRVVVDQVQQELLKALLRAAGASHGRPVYLTPSGKTLQIAAFGNPTVSAAGVEEKPLTLAEAGRELLNLGPSVQWVDLPAPYGKRVPVRDLLLSLAGDRQRTLEAIAREANVDGLFLIQEANEVRVEPPPTDPSRPRWTWPVAQVLVRYEQLTVDDQQLQEAVGNFPRPDRVRALLSARPVPAGEVRAALGQLQQEVDAIFTAANLNKDKKFPIIYASRPDLIREVLAGAVAAIPAPLENARQAGLNLIRAVLDYNVPLRIFGFDQAARSPSGNPIALLDARRLLQNDQNLLLVEQGEGDALILRSRQRQQDTDDQLEQEAVALERRLELSLVGRPRALAALTDQSLPQLLEALRGRTNWESLAIFHEDEPGAQRVFIPIFQNDAEYQFTRQFKRMIQHPYRALMTFDLSVFGRPGNRLHGQITFHRFVVAAGAEDRDQLSREFISRYLAIRDAKGDRTGREADIRRLVEVSDQIPLAGRSHYVDAASGSVHLDLPPRLPDVLMDRVNRLRPEQVLYDRVTGELYTYTEWGSGENRKSGLTPVFTQIRIFELTEEEGVSGKISYKRIERGEIVLLVPRATPSARATAAGAEEQYRLSPEATVLPTGLRGEDWFNLPGETKPGDIFLFKVAQNIAPTNLVYLIRVEASSQLSVLESGFSESWGKNVVAVSDWGRAQKVAQAQLKTGYGTVLVLQKEGALQINHPDFGGYHLSVNKLQPAAGAEEAVAETTAQVTVTGVRNIPMPLGAVPLQAVDLVVQGPELWNLSLRGLPPHEGTLTAFRTAATRVERPGSESDKGNPFFALTNGEKVFVLEPTETQSYTGTLRTEALKKIARDSLPADLATLPIILARDQKVRVDIRSPREVSAGMNLDVTFLPVKTSVEGGTTETVQSAGAEEARQARGVTLLIFNPAAGLALHNAGVGRALVVAANPDDAFRLVRSGISPQRLVGVITPGREKVDYTMLVPRIGSFVEIENGRGNWELKVVSEITRLVAPSGGQVAPVYDGPTLAAGLEQLGIPKPVIQQVLTGLEEAYNSLNRMQ